jgi:hypothetical protein
MTLTSHTQDLLSRLQGLLALSDDEIVQRGITQATTDRIIELRQRAAQLKERYGSLKELEARVAQGVPAGDHTLYTDLLEWRAARHELEQLTHFLEAV